MDEWLSITQARRISGLSRGVLLQLGHEGKIEMVKGSGKGWHKFNRHSLIEYLNQSQKDTRLQVMDTVLRLQEIVAKAQAAFAAEGLHREYQALTSLLAVLADR